MSDLWIVRRVRKSPFYVNRPDRTVAEYGMEEIVTGKGQTLDDAIINFQTNERINYEPNHFAPPPVPVRLRPYKC